TPLELLVATILSAQCTDERVNLTTPALFAAYAGPKELANAKVEDVELIIRSIGLYRNKAKNIVETAKIITEKFGGEVPPVREELEKLPGVGRKTASVVLAQGFGVPAFAVDTHVGRVSTRMGFSPSPDPLVTEKHLTALLLPEKWRDAHLILINHGRKYCMARSPDCENCPVGALCPAIGVKRKNETGG
ncbi:endonuclease III, partial [bacterium]